MAHSSRLADGMGPDLTLRNILSARVSVRSLPSSILRSYTDMFFSSRHLLGTGKEAEARTVVAQLNGVPEDDALVLDTIDELEFAIRMENEGGQATWLECFSQRNMLWKRTLNGMMLQFIQQLNGQNFYCKCHMFRGIDERLDTRALDYYGDTFFQSAGTE